MASDKIKILILSIIFLASLGRLALAETLPIDAFAMRPGILQASISPNGKHMGLLRAFSLNGDYRLEIYETAKLDKKPVVLGADRMELTGFYWLNDKKLWVDMRQKSRRGNNKWRYMSSIVNSDGTGKWRELPNEGKASILSMLRNYPDEILLEYDINDNRIPDVVRYNVNSGRKKTIFRGSTKFAQGFGVDAEGDVRLAVSFDAANVSIDYYARLKGTKEWKLIKKNHAEDRSTFNILGFNPEKSDEIFVLANNGEDKASIYALDIVTGKYTEKLFGLKSVDAGGIITSSKPGKSGNLLGFSYSTSRPNRVYINETEKALYNAVQNLFPEAHSRIVSRSIDDNSLVVYVSGPKDAGTYYMLRNKSELTFIGSKFPKIKPDHLSKVKYIKYKARDGLKIPSYVTIPQGKGPFPTIVMPHGGPWARDFPGYDEWSQLLAHNGYLVIQPQYRGSTGFGLAHWKVGDKSWGLTMQDDLDDAMDFLVKKGLADQDRLAMFGWSYGGYAAFVASMRENNIYKCAIAGAGVSDLSKMSAQIFGNFFARKSQRPTVKGISPIDHVKDVNIPIMVIHGDIDQRVNVSHSREFVDKLREYGKNYKYIELEGADHFSNTLFYDHKKKFYTELIDWLENKCF